MSSRDQRLCPGVDGRKCDARMSPVFRDPHHTCVRCRGRKCSSTATCDICHDWSLAQWESFHNKHSYAKRSKSNSRHAGAHTGATTNSPLTSASKSRAASPAPLPPSSEGPRVDGETLNDDFKRPRVSPSLSLSRNEQGERGGDADRGLAEGGTASAPPPPSEGGGGGVRPASAIPFSY